MFISEAFSDMLPEARHSFLVLVSFPERERMPPVP